MNLLSIPKWAFAIFILLFLDLKGYAQTTVWWDYCHSAKHDLPTTPSGEKNVPNTIVRSKELTVLVGYSDFDQFGRINPVFSVRGPLTPETARFTFAPLEAIEEEFGVPAKTYLMDMSDITAEGTFFVTGFGYFGPNLGPPSSVGFVAELTLDGQVLNTSILRVFNSINNDNMDPDNFNAIPYNITVDADNGKVLVTGEQFNRRTFDPFVTSYDHYSVSDEPGKAFILCLDKNSFNPFWSKTGTQYVNHQDGSQSTNFASMFENVCVTPMGYLAIGKMKAETFFSGNGASTRIEAVMFDFSGNIMWQKSLKLNYAFSKGVSAYFSQDNQKIYLLYQNSYSHTFGLVAIDPSTGVHGQMSDIPGPWPEGIASNIKLASPHEEILIVGGFGSNLASSTEMTPFYVLLKYDPGQDEFMPINNNALIYLHDGITYQTSVFGGYFSAFNHSFNMFDIDRTYSFVHNPISAYEGLYYFASKNAGLDEVLFYKATEIHCYCPRGSGNVGHFSYTIPESPTLDIADLEIEMQMVATSLDERNPGGDLVCGSYDGIDFIYSVSDKLDLKKTNGDFNEEDLVAVYDIVGREVFKGKYGVFVKSVQHEALSANPKVYVIINQATKKAKKAVFVK